MSSQREAVEYWKSRNAEENQGMKEKSEQKKAEEFLEDKGFVMCEYQPHRKISLFVRHIGGLTIYKSVKKSGDIVDGNLLEEKV
jgi:hypothetical protein